MNTKQLLQIATLGATLALGTTAFAKTHTGTAQTHHCKLADGSTDTSKTHKQCTAAKGTWAKDAAAPAAAPAPAPTSTSN